MILFWAATLASAAVHAYPIEIITQVEATVTFDGKTPSGPRSISLPYLWDGIPHQPDGSVQFKLRLGSLDPARPGPRAIYFARIGNRFEVRLNGTLISLPLNEQSPRVDLAKAPRLVVIPQSLLHGYDQLEIVILTQGLRRGGLSPIHFGMASDLMREFGKIYLSRITASLAVGCVSAVLGILAMLMWMQQRAPLFLLFGLAELAWAFRVSDVLIDEPPLGWPMWGVLVALAYALYVGLTARLSMLVLGIERGWFRIALLLYLLGACVASVGTYALGYQILWTAWLGLMVGAAMLCAMIASWVAWRSRKVEHLLLAFALLTSVAVGVRDWVYVWLVPEAFGAASWSRYVSVLFSLTLGWIIASRYARATRDLGVLNRTLADRVAERELQLVVSFDRTREAVQHAAALSERQRLMRDMHDGLGSRLTGAISILRNSEAPNPAVLEYLALPSRF